MKKSGYPARVDPRARLTIIVLVIVFVVGLVVALALIDAKRDSGGGGVQCPNSLDPRCEGQGSSTP
jgi:hypothetical protein